MSRSYDAENIWSDVGSCWRHVCASRKVRRWSVSIVGWSMGMRVRLSSIHTRCVFSKCSASRSAWAGGMSLSSRAQTMRTGPAKVRCWSTHSSSCWGAGTLRMYLVRSQRTLGLWRSGWSQLLNRSSGTRRFDRVPKGKGGRCRPL